MLKYDEFINESKNITVQDIVFKYYQDVEPYYNIEERMRPSAIDGYSMQHDKYSLDIKTYKGQFVITIIKSDTYDSTIGSPKALKLMDEKGYEIKSQDIIDHIYKAIFDFIEFIKLNKNIQINDRIAGALTGDLKYEKILFDSVYKSQHIKWSKFSKELIDTLTEKELNLMKSFKTINKFNLFENSSNLGNLTGYTKDLKVLYKKIEELNKNSKGWNHYAYKTGITDDLDNKTDAYEWNMYYTSGSDRFIITKDDKVKRIDMYDLVTDNVNVYNINKLTNSINSVYDYIFKPSVNNKFYSLIKEYFQNDFIQYNTLWSDLLNRLISEEKFSLIKEINWDESSLSNDEITNLLKSAKSISKFNL